MANGNESTVEIHHMGKQESGPGGGDGRGRPVSTFGWMATVVKGAGSACFHALTGPAAGPLILTCVCVALVYGARRRNKQDVLHGPKRDVLHRSMSIAALHGGEMILERILDFQAARLGQEALDSAAGRMKELLEAETRDIDFKELHRVAAKLEMGGKEDEAIEMLQKAVKKAKEKKQPHEAREFEMVLVEMLIYKGEYDQALECKCFKDVVISDARRPLYKAIIYTLKGDVKQAQESYEEFRDVRSRFHCDASMVEGSPLYGIVHDFKKFKEVVDNLKKEIQHAQTMHK